MNLTTTVVGARSALDLAAIASMMLPVDGEPRPAHHRELHLREGARIVPVYARFAMPLGSSVAGPAIVEQSDSTLFLDEGQPARVDHLGSIIVTD